MTEMTAAAVYRSSQGDEKKIGLDIQREEVPRLADNLDATITREVDLSIHTGFSSFVRGPESDNRLDAHPEVQQLLGELKDGEYDYLIAYNDSRLARDDFFFVLHYACIIGDCTIAFVEDTDLDSLEFRVRRVVEQHVKQTEIKNSKKARRRRRERGGREGTPPVGMQWDENRHGWIPDDDFEDVLKIIALKDAGGTHREVVSASPAVSSTGTITKIMNRRDEYENAMLEHGYTYPELA